MNATSRFRRKLADQPLTSIIAAHNPLGAVLAAEAGFDGIWASGFEFSASYAVPDASLLSMTQHLENVRSMAAATDIPIVADIDTGYGNAINVMYTVKHYEAAGAAAVVMEDKTFPKDTSLLDGGRQQLLRLEEFQGKLNAAIAARQDADFLVIARTEALIAGHGQDEAQRRARAYVEAGADAILVHSKSKTPDEIVEFSSRWDLDVPLVIVPTAYPQLTESAIKELKNVKLVIYGNHGIRAIVTALRNVFGQIRKDGGIQGVDKSIASVRDVFELQGVDIMKENERRYLR